MTPIQPEPLECVLCGVTSPDVHMALIRYHAPDGRPYFVTDPRCEDRKACEQRVDDIGKEPDDLTRTGL